MQKIKTHYLFLFLLPSGLILYLWRIIYIFPIFFSANKNLTHVYNPYDQIGILVSQKLEVGVRNEMKLPLFCPLSFYDNQSNPLTMLINQQRVMRIVLIPITPQIRCLALCWVNNCHQSMSLSFVGGKHCNQLFIK